MADMTYLDFDLQIERVAQGYRTRVLNSPAGQAMGEFMPPFTALELENFLLRVGRTRSVRRRADSPEMAAVRTVGGKLFDAVFTGELRDCLGRSLDATERLGARLRLRLRLMAAPELADLPWEYLYNSSLNRFLTLSVDSPLVRYLELPDHVRPLTVQPPLKMLVMIAGPSDHIPLEVEREWQNLNQALATLVQRGRLIITRLEQATLAALQRQLRQDEYHIFHFIGHGSFDATAQEGALLFEDDLQRGRKVTGNYLGTILHDERTLRLTLLNACEGARASQTDSFAGVAQSLVQQGMPAVIAMQFEITDEAAITFAQNFYEAVADGYPVDAALSEARKAIFAKGNELEWGTPVLYMRASDGQIFDVAHLTEPEVKSEDVASLYIDGRNHYEAGRWLEAMHALNRVRQLRPSFQDVEALIAKTQLELDKQKALAEKRAQIKSLLNSAQAAESVEDWAAALEQYQAVLVLDPFHADAKAKVASVQKQRTLSILYAEARQQVEAHNWREALQSLRRLSDQQKNYKDVNALLKTVERELAAAEAEAQKRAKITTLVSEARAAMSKEHWAQAIEKWQAVLNLEPTHVEAAEGYQQATRLQGPAALYAGGLQHYTARRWGEALAQFKRVQEMQNDYKDVTMLIGNCERELEKQRAEEQKRANVMTLSREAQAAMAREEWAIAMERWKAILNLDAANTEAATRLSQAKQQWELAMLYTRARQHDDAGRWTEAIADLRRIKAVQAKYKDVDALLSNVQSAMARTAAIAQPIPKARGRAGSGFKWLSVGGCIGIVVGLFVCVTALVWLGWVASPQTRPSSSLPSIQTKSPTSLPSIPGELLNPYGVPGQFMNALRSGNWTVAYSLCTLGLQRNLSSATVLGQRVETGIGRPLDWRVTRDDGVGNLEGMAIFAGNRIGTWRLQLQVERGSWYVNSFEFKLQ